MFLSNAIGHILDIKGFLLRFYKVFNFPFNSSGEDITLVRVIFKAEEFKHLKKTSSVGGNRCGRDQQPK